MTSHRRKRSTLLVFPCGKSCRCEIMAGQAQASQQSAHHLRPSTTCEIHFTVTLSSLSRTTLPSASRMASSAVACLPLWTAHRHRIEVRLMRLRPHVRGPRMRRPLWLVHPAQMQRALNNEVRAKRELFCHSPQRKPRQVQGARHFFVDLTRSGLGPAPASRPFTSRPRPSPLHSFVVRLDHRGACRDVRA